MGRIEDLKVDELIIACSNCRTQNNQKSCLTCKTVNSCNMFKECVNWFNNYDIKYEMFFLKDVVQSNGKKLKLGRVLSENNVKHLSYFSKGLVERINQLSEQPSLLDINTVNNNIVLYLFFKLQSKYGCSFDCDHLIKSLFHENRLVDDIFYHYLGCCREQRKDTIFSVQCIWGKTIESFQIGIKANDYKQQYEKLSTILDVFGKDLFDAFANLMHYYHTIGNFMPCPNPSSCGVQSYNQGKGLRNFDRMDYFIESGKGRTFLESEGCFGFYEGNRVLFLDSNFKEKYAIKSNILGKEYNLLMPSILSPKDLSAVINGIKEVENKNCKDSLCNYLNNVVEIIKRRTEVLVDNFISYAIGDHSEEKKCPQN